MKVMKFGGTSVGNPQRIQHVAKLISGGDAKFVVLSAMSGTTNTLIEICDYLARDNRLGAGNIISRLEQTYNEHVSHLYSKAEYKAKAGQFISETFNNLRKLSQMAYTISIRREIVSQGEILSTHLMTYYLEECDESVCLLSALDFMKIGADREPDELFISEKLREILKAHAGYNIYITQGFICRNVDGETDNLQRGGSDYTASLIGAAIGAEEIQIWTDIDGMHNNDPRYVENTKPVKQLNFDEAAELAYFGAKILHPTCILPAKFASIPVRLLNTLDPEAEGTVINNDMEQGKIKAIAAKDGITAIRIFSSRMLLASGFLSKVFDIFEHFKTSIDMITTSEVGVSMSIDNPEHINEITHELRKYGTVDITNNMCIICVVGDLRWGNVGYESLITDAMSEVPVRMISYGGSPHNISFLVKQEDKEKALKALSKKLFDN
jgi:aspartate kinase